MADNITRDFILEQFRENRRMHEETQDRLKRLESVVRAMKSHMVGLLQNDLTRDVDWAAHEERLKRIERRLDLVDDAD